MNTKCLHLFGLFLGFFIFSHAQVPREREPVPINMNEVATMIGFPSEASEKGIQGKVIINFKLDTLGNYMKHRVLQDPHPVLTAAVEAKLPFLRLTQAIKDGVPIECWVTIPFNFNFDPSVKEKHDLTTHVENAFHSLEKASQANPDQVKELYLHSQDLDHFPEEIFKFQNLVRLELGNNRIQTLPSQISSLDQLMVLGLSGNQLHELPKEIWKMKALLKVYVGGNNFSETACASLEKVHKGKLFPQDPSGKIAW